MQEFSGLPFGKTVKIDSRVLGSIQVAQFQVRKLDANLNPKLRGIGEAQRRFASQNEGVNHLAGRAKEAFRPLVQQTNDSCQRLARRFCKMQEEGEQRKVDLKAKCLGKNHPQAAGCPPKKWHKLHPELKPIELMTEKEFDENIIVIGSVFFPRIRTSYIECSVADLRGSREKLGKLRICEVAQYLDQLEAKSDDWEAYKKQCEAQTIEAQSVLPSSPSPRSNKMGQDRRFVIEGLKMLEDNEAASANHAAEILLKKYGWASKGLEPNSKGKIITSTYESGLTRLQKKIRSAL